MVDVKLLYKDFITKEESKEFIRELVNNEIRHTFVEFNGIIYVIYENEKGVTPLELLDGLMEIENKVLNLATPLACTEIVEDTLYIYSSYKEAYVKPRLLKTLERWVGVKIHVEYTHSIPMLLDIAYSDKLAIDEIEFVEIDKDVLLISCYSENGEYYVFNHKVDKQYIKVTGKDNVLEYLLQSKDFVQEDDTLYTPFGVESNRLLSKFLSMSVWNIKDSDTNIKKIVKILDEISLHIGKGDIKSIRKIPNVKVTKNSNQYNISITVSNINETLYKYKGICISYLDPNWLIEFKQPVIA